MPRSTSFPSGHSATAFAFATATSRELPALAPVLVPLASIVSYSRVHVGVHYPSDVLAGVAIGIGCGLVVGRPSACGIMCACSCSRSSCCSPPASS